MHRNRQPLHCRHANETSNLFVSFSRQINLYLAGLIALTLLALPTSLAQAAPPATSGVDSALRECQQLETEGRWGDALSLYQSTLKANPKNEVVNHRRSLARIHFDLQRRYSDRSFISTVEQADANVSLNVYAEVLLKVQSYYVDSPDWAQLASFGLTSLEVALMTPDFRQQNLAGVTDTQIEAAIYHTRQRLDDVTVKNRHDAYMVANSTAQALQDEIGLPVPATVYEFVCGAIAALDPYSAFMSASQYGETMSQIEGNFVGLGVELRTQDDHLEIVNVIDGGSACVAGLVSDDRILAVDGQSVSDIGADRAADMLRGVEGSFVQLTVERGGSAQPMNLERRRVEIPSVDNVQIIDSATGTGYIQLTNFQKTTPRDFEAALWELHAKGMRSLIVDVRGNPGGLLSASVEVADRFVSDGVIVSTRGRNQMENYTHRAKPASTWRVPLVVLVDENSASASEIFAAAIRDHARGLIVGHQSYGKGSVQGIFPLNVSGGGVRLTTAKFYSPDGQAISDNGVKADILVQNVARESGAASNELSEDTGIRVAIRAAQRLVAKRDSQRRQTSATRTRPASVAVGTVVHCSTMVPIVVFS